MQKKKRTINASVVADRSTADMLQQSIWVQSEPLLARAFLESHLFCDRLAKLAKKKKVYNVKTMASLEADALLLHQAIAQVAGLRGVALFGFEKRGVVFDEQRHRMLDVVPGKSKKNAKASVESEFVKVVTPGVGLGADGVDRVIIRAEVKARKVTRAQSSTLKKGGALKKKGAAPIEAAQSAKKAGKAKKKAPVKSGGQKVKKAKVVEKVTKKR